MKRIFSALIWLPILLVIIGFTLANRQLVTVSLDPISQAEPMFALAMPAWALVFVGIFIGLLLGWVAAWSGQRKWRKAARLHKHHLEQAKREVSQLKTSTTQTNIVPG